MQFLDLTLKSGQENLALDEALLEQAEQSEQTTEVLRLWEPSQVMVVLGRSSRARVEVNLRACQEQHISVLRRSSGGAAIVAGPGCLMYSLVLSYQKRPELRSIARAHRFVLWTMEAALGKHLPDVLAMGTSDLTFKCRKFSGNSLRCRRHHMLYHGTLLYDFPLALFEQLLGVPPRQPDYREGRTHGQFVTNLPIDAQALRRAIIAAWNADEPLKDWPKKLVDKLVTQKYQCREWNFRH